MSLCSREDPVGSSSRAAEQQHLAGGGRGGPRPSGCLHNHHHLLEALQLGEAGVPTRRYQHHPAEAEGQRSAAARV